MQSNKKKKTKQKVKARTFTVTAETRRLTYGGLNFIPFIRLRGKWLETAGFRIGQRITVCILKNRLVITPEKQSEKTNYR